MASEKKKGLLPKGKWWQQEGPEQKAGNTSTSKAKVAEEQTREARRQEKNWNKVTDTQVQRISRRK